MAKKELAGEIKPGETLQPRGDNSPAATPGGTLQGSGDVPIVGIGYSAGGLEAAKTIFSRLSPDTGMAFIVVQHIKAGHESHLVEILETCTSMPVKEIENGLSVKPNSVYVFPCSCDVVLAGDYFNVHPRSDSESRHLCIDFFLTTLAQSRKSRAIGVILSGTGSDGTLGLKAIKSEGGVTIVQDPKAAKFDGMPRSAIASGIVDLILPEEEIAKELMRIAKHPYTIGPLMKEVVGESLGEAPEDRDEAGQSPAVNSIVDILNAHTKVNFSKYKMSTIKRRIERQMMLRKIETIEKYAEYLNKNKDEVRSLYEDIFIHVTDFFRDPEAFEALKENVFPALLKKRPSNAALRVWVPGCATGEEVYSLAIVILEYLEANSLKTPLQIFGTDISEPAIHKARQGIYPEYQMNKLSSERLNTYFTRVKEGYKIKKDIRDLCIFSRHDVTSNPPIPKVDLISCRNVLIYFSAELQKRVFPVFHYALNPVGFLWLGRAENPGMYSKLFTPVDKTNKIFAKIKGSTSLQGDFSTTTFGAGYETAFKGPVNPGSPADSFRSADQVILFRYSPPSVIVSDKLEILQFRGRTVPFLEPAPGLAHYSLLKMANADLAAPLRMCIQAAKKQNAQVRKEGLSFKFEEKTRKVNLDVSPLNPSAPPSERQYLVVFEEKSGLGYARPKPKPAKTVKLTKKERQNQIETLIQYNSQLQQELETAREYQQSLIEEYETAQEELTSANEELRSTNEELQSTNEELHSANEELDTSKEELQAANEELVSTNEELQKRNVEIEKALYEVEQSERRFRLMIEAVKDYAIFMLDATGHVASWNLGAERLKGYSAKEIIGSHFSRFYTPEDVARKHPQEELRIAAEKGVYKEEGWRVRKDGTRFWAFVVITAIRDAGQLIGFGKVTRDLTERKRAEEELRKSRDELEVRVRDRTMELSKANRELEKAVQARDGFLSLASHELKTPLTSLLMQSQLRERNLKKDNAGGFTPEKLKGLFENDKKQINRLARLVDDMLDVSRISSRRLDLKYEVFDFCALTKDVLERFDEQFRAAGCEVVFDQCEKAEGRFDRFRMEQVLVNLFTNAIKYGRGKPVHVGITKKDGNVVLSVRDQGIGISKEDQERIFKQFERASNSSVASGLGLGLYIARHIVEAHNGRIRVESQLDHGATFIVEIPLEKGFQ